MDASPRASPARSRRDCDRSTYPVGFIPRCSRLCRRPGPSLRTSTFRNGRRSSRSWLPPVREGSGRRGGGTGSGLAAGSSAFGRSFHSPPSPATDEGPGAATGSTASTRTFRGRPGLRLGEGRGSALPRHGSDGRSRVGTFLGRPRGRFCGKAVSSEGAGAEATAGGSIAAQDQSVPASPSRAAARWRPRPARLPADLRSSDRACDASQPAGPAIRHSGV